jgi:hypothetical protein
MVIFIFITFFDFDTNFGLNLFNYELFIFRATHPKIIRQSFRNWYQRGYPYVFCSVRLCV